MVTYENGWVWNMNWQRARTDDKKNERRDSIHIAAYNLFKKLGYEQVSFNNIAKQAGFTKSNMYRYFSSKEDIFLSIFSQLFNAWFDEFHCSLAKIESNAEPEQFANAWVSACQNHHSFLDLTPILFVSLEGNSSYEKLVDFKKLSKGLLYQLSLQITRIYPDIQDENAFKLLTMSYAAMSNYWAGSTKNDTLSRVYQLEELQDMQPQFEYELTTAIVITIKGLLAN